MADPKTQLETVIDNAITKSLLELHTMAPGIVQAWYPDEEEADIQITIKRKQDGKLVNLPLLPHVPVRFFKCGSFAMTCEVTVGDYLMVIFSERSNDTWLESGGVQDPGDSRRHSLSDAYAIPFMYPQSEKIGDISEDTLQIKTLDGSTILSIEKGGKIKIKGDLEVDGDIKSTKSIEAATEVSAGPTKIGLTNHLTPGIGLIDSTGGAVSGTTTQPPIPGV
jgi:hypothetical protein